ncbi:hypothetical protein STIAU_3313 [Stigmatella aurantiaca DW4/3-1]|uniref:Uncharacterized protein n=1 Tax=Stigmatella aurantiaca (strain DW4/3-1) TaxID=378806 RepID=Q099N5_STIAD|nr:hypothetical protein STIAU_3313 [Stigmatella aurantiaca DW4/3-1]
MSIRAAALWACAEMSLADGAWIPCTVSSNRLEHAPSPESKLHLFHLMPWNNLLRRAGGP